MRQTQDAPCLPKDIGSDYTYSSVNSSDESRPACNTTSDMKTLSDSPNSDTEKPESPKDVPPKPIQLPDKLKRPTPYSALWTYARLNDTPIPMALAHLRVWSHPRRHRELTEATVQQIRTLKVDDGLRALQELKDPRIYVRGTNGRKLELKATVTTLDTGSTTNAAALLDSGCEGSCIDRKFVHAQGYNTKTLPRPIPVMLADGTAAAEGPITEMVTLNLRIGHHVERIDFAITDLGSQPIFLRHDWLKEHNPTIDWRTGTLEFDRCPAQCQPLRSYAMTSDEEDDLLEMPMELWRKATYDQLRRADQDPRFLHAFHPTRH